MKHMKQEIKIYSPDNIYKQSLLNIFKEMASNITENYELVWRLFSKDVKAKYKQSILGPAWVVIMPFATIATFLLLNMSGVISIRNLPVPYPIYGFLGISLWTLFSQGLTLTTDSIPAAAAMIGKTNTPKEVFVITALGQTVVDFCVRILLLFLIYLIYKRSPSLWILVFPLYTLPLFLFTLGLGFFTSVLNTIFRDTIHIVSIALNFLIFLTPIMYTFPEGGILAFLNSYNPLFFLIQTPREIIISGKIYSPIEFFLSTLFALFVFIGGWLLFYRAEARLTERI